MDCVDNNNIKIIKGANFEIKQVEPNQATVNEYQNYIASITKDKDILEIALLESRLKEAGSDEEKEEIQVKINEHKKSADDYTDIINKAYTVLVLGTLKGSFIESGYVRKEGKDLELTEKLVLDLGTKLFDILQNNAIELIKYDKEEIQKN